MENFNINNSDDFEIIVNDVRNGRIPFLCKEPYWELYRGQSKNTYELKSSLSRNCTSSEELLIKEKELIDTFKEIISKTVNPNKYIHLSNNILAFENEWRWIEQAQHYRLPTRLLDWTTKPEIAFFFAVENSINNIGQFWVYKSHLDWSCDLHFDKDPYSENDFDIISNSSFYITENYNDKIAEERRSFQDGKFIIQNHKQSLLSMEKQDKLKNKIIKHTINPKAKEELLKYLNNKNITKETVYVRYDEEIENIISDIKLKFNLK